MTRRHGAATGLTATTMLKNDIVNYTYIIYVIQKQRCGLAHIAAFLFQSQISKTEGMTEKVIPSDVVYPLWAFFLLKKPQPLAGEGIAHINFGAIVYSCSMLLSMSTPCCCLYTYGNVVAYISSMPLSVIFISLFLYKSPTACL